MKSVFLTHGPQVTSNMASPIYSLVSIVLQRSGSRGSSSKCYSCDLWAAMRRRGIGAIDKGKLAKVFAVSRLIGAPVLYDDEAVLTGSG